MLQVWGHEVCSQEIGRHQVQVTRGNRFSCAPALKCSVLSRPKKHIFPQGETAYVRVKEDYGGGDSGTAGRRSRTRWAIRRVLRIRDVYPGSEFFPSRIRIKEFKYFNPNKWFLALGNKTRVVNPGSVFLPIPDPGVKKAPDPGSTTLIWTSLSDPIFLCFYAGPDLDLELLSSADQVPEPSFFNAGPEQNKAELKLRRCSESSYYSSSSLVQNMEAARREKPIIIRQPSTALWTQNCINARSGSA